MTPLSDGTPAHIRIHFIFLASWIIGLHFATNDIGLSSFEFFWWAQQDFSISKRGSFPPFKVTDIGANRKLICDFLLVRNSNLGPILYRFGDLTALMCSWPHPYSNLIFGVFPLHQIAHVGVSERMALSYLAVELFSKNSNLCDHGT